MTGSDKLYSCGGWMVVIRFVVDVLVTVSDKLYSCGGWIVSLCLCGCVGDWF